MMCTNGLFRRIGLAFACMSLGAFLLTGVSTRCHATGSLDQEFAPSVTTTQAMYTLHSYGQTFTVGLDGTLTAFDVYLSNTASVTSDLDWEVQSTSGGLPDGTVLASGAIAGTSISGANQWIPVDVSSAAISVAVGEVYAIVITGQVVSGSGPPIYWLGATDSNATYTGGEKVFKSNPSGSWGFYTPTVTDYGFRTYVPEPSQVALTFMALGTLVLVARIRKSADKI